LTGKVDAIFSAHAHAADIKAFLGARAVIDLGKHPERCLRINNGTPLALTASGALIAERPDLVARWLANVLEAAEWTRTHRDKTLRIIAAESGVAEEIALEAFGEDLPDQLSPNLSEDKVAAVNSQKEFLLRHGFIANDFDIEKFTARAPLAEAQRIVNDPKRTHRRRRSSRLELLRTSISDPAKTAVASTIDSEDRALRD
jgi:ABC-type nitrate/sulfonate/bicarbonate transport system substrate-binding protein